MMFIKYIDFEYGLNTRIMYVNLKCRFNELIKLTIKMLN